jgi:hypothetical protein
VSLSVRRVRPSQMVSGPMPTASVRRRSSWRAGAVAEHSMAVVRSQLGLAALDIEEMLEQARWPDYAPPCRREERVRCGCRQAPLIRATLGSASRPLVEGSPVA